MHKQTLLLFSELLKALGPYETWQLIYFTVGHRCIAGLESVHVSFAASDSAVKLDMMQRMHANLAHDFHRLSRIFGMRTEDKPRPYRR